MAARPKYLGSDRKALQARLRDAGFRSTEGRLALLAALKRSKKPVSVEALAQALIEKLDEANVYRALEALKAAGIVTRIDLQHGHAHYEFKPGPDGHHHHLVCTSCDRIEDIAECASEALSSRVLAHAPSFSRITGHSFELFGVCNACASA